MSRGSPGYTMVLGALPRELTVPGSVVLCESDTAADRLLDGGTAMMLVADGAAEWLDEWNTWHGEQLAPLKA